MTQPNEVPAAAPAPAPAPAAQPEPIHVDDAGTEHFTPSPDGLHVTRCAMCDAVDDHPKHGFVLNSQTGEETRRHMDCCASAGCPVCAKQIAGAGGVIGHELRTHLVSLPKIGA